MNRVQLTGYVKEEKLELRHTGKDTAVANVTLIVPRLRGEGADFFTVAFFGKAAENAVKYFKKGSKILIEGSLRNNNYTNKEGQKIYGNSILGESFEFCERKNHSSDNTEKAAEDAKEEFTDIPEGVTEEIPFA